MVEWVSVVHGAHTTYTCGTVKSWQSIRGDRNKSISHTLFDDFNTISTYVVWQCAMSCHRIWLNYNARSFVRLLAHSLHRVYISQQYVCSIYLPHIRYAVHAIRFRRACHPTNQQRTIEATVLYMCQKCTSIAMVYTEPLSLSLSLCSTLSLHIHSLTPCTEPLKQPRIAKAHPNC